jgi:putative membrane protein
MAEDHDTRTERYARRLTQLAFGAALAWGTGSALAKPTDGDVGEQSGQASVRPLNAADTELLTALHATNRAEIEAGKLGAEQAGDPLVKRYAEMIMRDHGSADEKVFVLARSRDVVLRSPEPHGESERTRKDAEHRAPMNELRAKQGTAFDQQFTAVMVEGHREAIQTVRDGLASTTDLEMKELLTALLLTLEKHLASAEALQNKVDAASEPAP